MRKTLLAATAALALSVSAVAQAPFTAQDIPRIVEVSRSNELRFDRDFKGQPFQATLTFKSVAEPLLGIGGHLVQFEGAYCSISDRDVLNKIIDWVKGQSVQVSGTIETTMMGDLSLTSCIFNTATKEAPEPESSAEEPVVPQNEKPVTPPHGHVSAHCLPCGI